MVLRPRFSSRSTRPMPKGLAFARSTSSGASRGARHRRRVDHGLSTRSGSLERGLPVDEAMNVRRHTKFVREGAYGAEVDVELIDEGNGWSPYLSLDDARKLDAVREALRRADLEAASRLARVFS